MFLYVFKVSFPFKVMQSVFSVPGKCYINKMSSSSYYYYYEYNYREPM